MPYYPKSEDWLHHSSLLLQAYPETTRITTRYHISPARRPSKAERAAHKAAANPATGTYPPRAVTTEGEAKPPRGHLVLKTFDPTSGVSLKYKTSKAAEVGRLVQMLGVLGRRMGGLEEKEEVGGQEGEVVGEEMVGVEGGSGAAAAAPAAVVGGGDKGGPGGGDKAGAGKKKKKGKK